MSVLDVFKCDVCGVREDAVFMPGVVTLRGGTPQWWWRVDGADCCSKGCAVAYIEGKDKPLPGQIIEVQP